MNVEGKRVLITGGSSGIGLATAQALVRKARRSPLQGGARTSSPPRSAGSALRVDWLIASLPTWPLGKGA
jgi:NAD(P)-dependent dehydrogenase (short-subunit alcohol dehydrogenase family)